MAQQGSAGNVIAAICSFFIPGLGQLFQGRLLRAIIFFVLAIAFWSGSVVIPFLGLIIHVWAIVDAAVYRSR